MIETVLGPIAPEDLGPTSMHEHLLCDVRALAAPATEPAPSDPRVRQENLGFLRFNALALADNLVLDDPDLAARELARVAPLGQRTVVDPTVWGFGGPAAALPAVSRASGVQIVAGVGAYLGVTRPDWLRALDVDALTERFVGALRDRLPGCEHRAGVVGMIGTSHPPTAEDEVVLRAAATATTTTGSALIARTDPRFRAGPELVARLEREGVAPERVVLSNIDGYAPDLAPLRELAATGATLKWCFGYEAPPRVGLTSATDAQRIDALVALLEEGHERQVLACGVWTKHALRAYGGPGYDHLALRIVPALRERGLDDDAVADLLVGQPRRLLDRP
ncbi:phosphotriesterase family protein [Patulibacter defluvii]|uniref:phosphotriesterase family protein n=1 Tax=Patulibacter defluvii TaxID=3095358 RepID=UPI002A765E1C|nr:phosphotriesterase [Patulibacter sp. DM4]